MDDTARYNAARLQVQRLRGFYINLSVYVLVNVLLLAINLATAPDHLWFYWPLLGWGVGIAAHAASVFVDRSISRQGVGRAQDQRAHGQEPVAVITR